jgi:phosphohistidine swiveling domain-containing protein
MTASSDDPDATMGTRMPAGVLWRGSARLEVEESAGGKAANLFRLEQSGVSTPPWTVIGAEILIEFRRISHVDAAITSALKDVTSETATNVAARIAQLFREAPLDERTLAAVEAAYECIGAGVVAVRSSGREEDGARLSFAGQYASFLGVSGLPAVIECVRACWASAYSAQSLTYRLANSVTPKVSDMGVILQVMVDADKSGVLFTANPTSGRPNELIISATYGLGEALVSGAVDADTITVDRLTREIKDTVVGYKGERVDAARDGGTTMGIVAAEDRERLSLATKEVNGLLELAKQIEAIFGAPQDIEWAIQDGALWALQSRPITTFIRGEPTGELRIWDNSNIIESYGDDVAPLTYTFARYVYDCVYTEYCELLGVPKRHIEEMEGWLGNMLGYFDGRVYYNLLNWYKVIRLLPFYSLNRRVLELSIGVEESLSEDLALEQRAFEARSVLVDRMLHALFAARFAGYFLSTERMVNRFSRDFYAIYDEIEKEEWAGRPADELYQVFRKVEQHLLARFGRMVILEASIGLAFGTLYALHQRWLSDAPEWLLFEAVRVDSDLESARPAQRLREIAQLVREDEQLRQRLVELEPRSALSQLRGEAGNPMVDRLLTEIDAYLESYGYRNVNELKLEEPDLREDPAMLFEMLRSTVAQLDDQTTRSHQEEQRPSADDYLRRHLRSWQRPIYGLVRRKVRRSLAARERVRFCRTRAFGMARQIFKAIGSDLARCEAIEAPEDVFYLRLEELRGCFSGTVAHRELTPLIDVRKKQQCENRTLDPPGRFTTRGSIYWGGRGHPWDTAVPSHMTGTEGQLRGTPASPGTAEGLARVVDRPIDVGGSVLVTYRTDPGWTGVLASARALLIERGSPLTHVAIVARELGIPTIVQLREVTKRVQTGMMLRVDGTTGVVEIIEEERPQ